MTWEFLAIGFKSFQEKVGPCNTIVFWVDSGQSYASEPVGNGRIEDAYGVRLDVRLKVTGSSSVLLICIGLPEEKHRKKKAVRRVQNVDGCILRRALDDGSLRRIMTRQKAGSV